MGRMAEKEERSISQKKLMQCVACILHLRIAHHVISWNAIVARSQPNTIAGAFETALLGKRENLHEFQNYSELQLKSLYGSTKNQPVFVR